MATGNDPNTATTAADEVPLDGPSELHAGTHVLVVDDETGVRWATERLLRQAGYQVTAVATGDEATEQLRSGLRPDVVLTDVVLPGTAQGPDVAVLAGVVVPAVELVFMSGYSADLLQHEALRRPGVRYLAKPFSADALLDKVAAAGRASGVRG